MKGERDFWTRRRAAVEAEEAGKQSDAHRRDRERAQSTLAERPEDEVLSELALPSPEEVCSGAEARKFMAATVPEYLRRRALRSLWKSNPVLACRDGLNDYDGDFTNAATDAPGVKTAYRVGKGLKAHLDHLAERSETDEAPITNDAVGIATGELAAVETEVDETVPHDPVAEAREDEAPRTPRPRRMAFRFAGDAA